MGNIILYFLLYSTEYTHFQYDSWATS